MFGKRVNLFVLVVQEVLLMGWGNHSSRNLGEPTFKGNMCHQRKKRCSVCSFPEI
jgi:hypothetical protein